MAYIMGRTSGHVGGSAVAGHPGYDAVESHRAATDQRNNARASADNAAWSRAYTQPRPLFSTLGKAAGPAMAARNFNRQKLGLPPAYGVGPGGQPTPIYSPEQPGYGGPGYGGPGMGITTGINATVPPNALQVGRSNLLEGTGAPLSPMDAQGLETAHNSLGREFLTSADTAFTRDSAFDITQLMNQADQARARAALGWGGLGTQYEGMMLDDDLAGRGNGLQYLNMARQLFGNG